MKYDHTELYRLVLALLEDRPEKDLTWCIQECHDGRLHHPINQENLHLFRRFRNDPENGSGNAQVLIERARAALRLLDEVVDKIRYAQIPFGSKGTQIVIVIGETPTKFKTVRFNASRNAFNTTTSYDYDTQKHTFLGFSISPVKKELVKFIPRDAAIFDACRRSGQDKSYIEEQFQEVQNAFSPNNSTEVTS